MRLNAFFLTGNLYFYHEDFVFFVEKYIFQDTILITKDQDFKKICR